MKVWIKQDGTEIELNDLPATTVEAKRLGWKLKKGKAKKES